MWIFQSVKKQAWSKNLVLFTSLAARLILVGYACLHDYFFKVDFTDIDYHVFSDAAHYVAEGKSPYERATYRYTPLLAWMLVPNEYWQDFGKILFCLADITVGWLLFKIMEMNAEKSIPKSNEQGLIDNSVKLVTIFWLANPLTAVISSRGNADVLVCASVLLCLYFLENEKWILSALVHGIAAVHLKIYPLIYLPSIFIYLSVFAKHHGLISKFGALITNVRGYAYIIISLLSLLLIILTFHSIYGNVFLEEFLLYHIRRTDTRHNFSPYFLPLYLIGDDAVLLKIIGLGAFLPQVVCIVYFAFKYYSDLPFCWFMTTFAFVTFNKVCTSQYFIWYIVFLPLVCKRIQCFPQRYFHTIFIIRDSQLEKKYSNPTFQMVFYLIGLGLGDVEDITVKGLNAIKRCSRVYLEAYTSILCYGLDKSKLEEFYGRPVIEADRTMVEQMSDEILNGSDKEDVAMLVVGDPFGATTHADLVLRAKEKEIPVKVIHNVSIMNAVGCCGLQLYSFGETVSIVMWLDGWEPDSYYDRIESNKKKGLHTLCLLDIKTKEQSVENLMRGRKIYEPPRYLTCSEAATQLLKIAERKKEAGIEPVFNEDTPCVGLARVGWDDQKIAFCSLKEMSSTDMGAPLHSLIIPGEMHPLEVDLLNTFKL